MKISYNWLKTLINNQDITPEQVSVALTDCGLEVESMESFESVKGMLKGVVVGHVLEKEKHPNADKLSLTKVDVGNGTILSIVPLPTSTLVKLSFLAFWCFFFFKTCPTTTPFSIPFTLSKLSMLSTSSPQSVSATETCSGVISWLFIRVLSQLYEIFILTN